MTKETTPDPTQPEKYTPPEFREHRSRIPQEVQNQLIVFYDLFTQALQQLYIENSMSTYWLELESENPESILAVVEKIISLAKLPYLKEAGVVQGQNANYKRFTLKPPEQLDTSKALGGVHIAADAFIPERDIYPTVNLAIRTNTAVDEYYITGSKMQSFKNKFERIVRDSLKTGDQVTWIERQEHKQGVFKSWTRRRLSEEELTYHQGAIAEDGTVENHSRAIVEVEDKESEVNASTLTFADENQAREIVSKNL